MTSTLLASINTLVRQAETFIKAGNLNQSYACTNQIIAALPDDAIGYSLRATVASNRCKFTEEAIDLEKAISLAPDNVEYKITLGLAYINSNQHEKALTVLNQALQQEPNSHKTLLAIGALYYELQDFAQSETYYQRSLTINPSWARTHLNLSLLYLTQAKYEQGWAEYEWRLGMPELNYLARNFSAPRWQGEDIRYKSLLIYCEQGFGDIFQFSRFLSIIKQPHNQIIIETSPTLVPIFTNMPWVDLVITKGAPLPPFDYYASVISLPHLTKTYTELPETVPYIVSDKTKKNYWHQQLKPYIGKKIGICWTGKSTNKLNPRRACPLEPLLQACDIKDVHIINLKKAPVPEDKLLLNKYNVIDFTDEIKNFGETAALIDTLDLIITIDTAIAHLAGCMGKLVWTLLSVIPEWRYLLLPDTCAWYPSMRLIRQPARGDWNSVLACLRKDLLQWK